MFDLLVICREEDITSMGCSILYVFYSSAFVGRKCYVGNSVHMRVVENCLVRNMW